MSDIFGRLAGMAVHALPQLAPRRPSRHEPPNGAATTAAFDGSHLPTDVDAPGGLMEVVEVASEARPAREAGPAHAEAKVAAKTSLERAEPAKPAKPATVPTDDPVVSAGEPRHGSPSVVTARVTSGPEPASEPVRDTLTSPVVGVDRATAPATSSRSVRPPSRPIDPTMESTLSVASAGQPTTRRGSTTPAGNPPVVSSFAAQVPAPHATVASRPQADRIAGTAQGTPLELDQPTLGGRRGGPVSGDTLTSTPEDRPPALPFRLQALAAPGIGTHEAGARSGRAEVASGPTVHVTIGRVEVRAAQPGPVAPVAPAPERRAPRVSLDEYLERREATWK